jgi:hypothetical protein
MIPFYMIFRSRLVLFICSLFYGVFSLTKNIAISEWRIGKDLEGSGRGLILKYYSGIRVEGLRKTTKDLSQDSRFPVWDLSPGPPKYEAGVLTALLWRPVARLIYHPDDGGSTHLWNVCLLQGGYMRYIPESFHLHTCRRENLKSHTA